MKYEYKIINIAEGIDLEEAMEAAFGQISAMLGEEDEEATKASKKIIGKMEKRLNALGEQGWRVAAMQDQMVILMREKK